MAQIIIMVFLSSDLVNTCVHAFAETTYRYHYVRRRFEIHAGKNKNDSITLRFNICTDPFSVNAHPFQCQNEAWRHIHIIFTFILEQTLSSCVVIHRQISCHSVGRGRTMRHLLSSLWIGTAGRPKRQSHAGKRALGPCGSFRVRYRVLEKVFFPLFEGLSHHGGSLLFRM